MKDIPVFTTDWGIASLGLREIPYRSQAYIRLQTVQPGHLEDVLRECVSFCRMAGAEFVYGTGDDDLRKYPVYTSILNMRGMVASQEDKIKNLFPVTEATVTQWRKICNERMAQVDCASTLTAGDEKKLLENPGAYFVHDHGELLGVGLMEDTALRLMATVKPGMGETVMRTLLSLVGEEPVTLEVAATNIRALRLYEKMGFLTVSEGTKWYQIFPEK